VDYHFIQPNPWMILPFVALLAAIALGPLVFPKWWGKYYARLTLGLAVFPLAYYLFGLKAYGQVLETGHHYLSFILLIGSLFVVSGGIHIRVKGEATPLANVGFLLIGALLSNVIGTTGASMLLIRPWIRMNKFRITGHHIVFFIFIVSNVGGCLTPIGDPPLFLGYLKGIPFWWIAQEGWLIWLVGNLWLLTVFFVVDVLNFRRSPRAVRDQLLENPERFKLEGLRNIGFLLVILAAVFVDRPMFLREALMAGAAVGSWFATPRPIHESNHFDFHPIREVAILFAGIFATMLPALDWLQADAGQIGSSTPAFYYWGTGTLSGFLDNAPTYLSFLSALIGSSVEPAVVEQVRHFVQNHLVSLNQITGPNAETIRNTIATLQRFHPADVQAGAVSIEQVNVAMLLSEPRLCKFVMAISFGAVFFGACTYIGNGPNFLVKSIADHQKVHTPGFLSYILRYTLPYLLPMLVFVWLLFFRK
jgi:Na+/H+ antiporter NhaD/arsenite permease-like protein